LLREVMKKQFKTYKKVSKANVKRSTRELEKAGGRTSAKKNNLSGASIECTFS